MIAQPYGEPTACPDEIDTDPHAGRSILVVDDDADVCECLAHGLRRQGFITATASGAEEAITLARCERPDLIVLDYQLPDDDGFTVCRRLEESPATAAIPVIMLSGNTEVEMIRRSRAAGCRFYMQKPFDPNALLTLIDVCLTDAA